MQALILAGGEGTRLRPLTSTIPKPVVPLVDRPFISYMLEWLRGHGVRDVIMSCGFLADGVREVMGDGSQLGVRLRYVEEPRPLGTAGALKLAEELLEERFFMLNGDVLSDIDLTAALAQHALTGARATITLVPVDNPSAYGLVRRNDDLSVQEFVEKPSPEQIDTHLINAGAYILQRELLEDMAPAGTNVSIERDVFPALVGEGLFGFEAAGYWLDIGTPAGYLQGTFDILEGNVATEVGLALQRAGNLAVDGVRLEGEVLAPAYLGAGCVIAAGATVGARVVLGRDVTVAAGSRIESSVLLEGVSVGSGCVVRSSIVCPGAQIGEHCHIGPDAVIGAGVRIGPARTITAGARIFSGVELPETEISS